MEGRNRGTDRLIAPTDFTTPVVPEKILEDLVPPSHFLRSVHHAGTPTSISWTNPISVTSTDPGPANPWVAITKAQKEILELRKENQRIRALQESERDPVDHLSNYRARSESGELRSKWELEWRLEAEKHKCEAERLKGQVQALKETAERYREEMRDKDNTLKRQCHDLEELRKELYKSQTELSQIQEELAHSNVQKEKINSQRERLKRESDEAVAKMRRDGERCEEEARALMLKAEMSRLQAEEEAKNLSEQMQEMQKKWEVKLQQLSASHSSALGAARQTNGEVQRLLEAATSEVVQLRRSLSETASERDELKEHLSQMEHAFKTQSAMLHSLRTYIGQLVPENGEKQQLNEALERMKREKVAFQKTTELLNVRLNSLNEILVLQEEKILNKTSTDPLVKNGSEGLRVLHLWRERVFKLCVQLRSRDIELREETDVLLSKVTCLQQQLQQQQHQTSVLQHTLQATMAQLDMEKVEKESLKQDLAQAQTENCQRTSQRHKTEAEVKTLTDAVQRFSVTFENRVRELDAAQAKLNTLTQRLTFATRRVETTQGLIMRRAALQKVQQASKQEEVAVDSMEKLQTELSLVCKERDKLTQELKRTPQLIEKALADMKTQYESKLTKQQQELEWSWVEVQQAVAGKEADQRSLQQLQAQLEESRVEVHRLQLERHWLQSELHSLNENREQALLERVSEIEDRCAEKLRAMEVEVDTARREHTKAVMTLRRFDREAARKETHLRETEDVQRQHTHRDVGNKHPKDQDGDTGLASAAETNFASAHTSAAHQLSEGQEAPERSRPEDATVHLPADERLFCVLDELRTLSAAVLNSSEDSAEEQEEQRDCVGPSTDRL